MFIRKGFSNALLWGGLALFLIGIATSCVSCGAGLGGALEGDAAAAEAGGSGVAIGMTLLFFGLVAAIAGAVGKMIASARED